MKLSEQIRAAAKRLTPETWIKRKFFENKGGTLCMCAHGAMQAECNPSVKRAVAAIDVNGARTYACDWLGVDASIDACYAATKSNNTRNIWKSRPFWIQNTRQKYGNVEAHYLLGMVGLTSSFNDHPKTTLEQVLEKFEQAAKLAESLGV